MHKLVLSFCLHKKEIIEEITLERDVSAEKKILAKLTIQKRNMDDEFYGELYLDHDYREGSEGTSCMYVSYHWFHRFEFLWK